MDGAEVQLVRKQFDEIYQLKNESAMLYLKATDLWSRYSNPDCEEHINLKRALSIYFSNHYDGAAGVAIFKLDKLKMVEQRLREDGILPDIQIAVENVALTVRRIDQLAENTRTIIGILDMPLWQRWFRLQRNSLAEDRYRSIHDYLEELIKTRYQNQSTTSVAKMIAWLQKVIGGILTNAAGLVQEMDRLINQISPTIPLEPIQSQTNQPEQQPAPVQEQQKPNGSAKNKNKQTNTTDAQQTNHTTENAQNTQPFTAPTSYPFLLTDGGQGQPTAFGASQPDTINPLQGRQMLRTISEKLEDSLNEFSYKLEAKIDGLYERVRRLEVSGARPNDPRPAGPIIFPQKHLAAFDNNETDDRKGIRSASAIRSLSDGGIYVKPSHLDYQRRSMLQHECRRLSEQMKGFTELEEYIALREDQHWREDFFRLAARLLATAPKTVQDLATTLQTEVKTSKALTDYSVIYELLRLWEQRNGGYLDPENLIEYLLSPGLFNEQPNWDDFTDISQKDIAQRLLAKIRDSIMLCRQRKNQHGHNDHVLTRYGLA